MAKNGNKALLKEKIGELDYYIPKVDDPLERLVLLNDKRKLYEEVEDELECDALASVLISRLSDFLSTYDNLSQDDKIKINNMMRQNYIVRARRHMDEYWIALEYDRRPENMFYLPRRRVLKPIIEAHQQIIDGELDFLAISQPKRTGKTTTGVGLITHLAGRYIRKGILASGAGSTLVNSFNRGISEILTSEEYNFNEIFPKAKVVDSSAEYMSYDLGVKKRFPSITCRSIDGAIVGNTEASSLLYLDDCVEGFEEARSYDRLEKKWEKIRGDVMGRRVEGCPIVCCGTRYSLKDPIGMLIDLAEQIGWRYKVLEVPALDENDNSNWDFTDDAYNLMGVRPDEPNKPLIKGSFSTKYYRNERVVVSPETWESEFQQQPIETKGLLFHEEEMNFYENLPDEEPDSVLMVVDVAGDGSDSTSAPLAYVYGRNVYIDDWLFYDLTSDKSKLMLSSFIIEKKPKKVRFESNNGGKEYGVNIKKSVDELDPYNRFNFEYKVTQGNKDSKIYTCAGNIKEYFWFRRDKYKKQGSPYWKAMRELFNYNSNGKNKHDDSPDSLAMLELLVAEMTRPQGKIYMLDRSSIGL